MQPGVAVDGKWGQVHWGLRTNGSAPAMEFFNREMTADEQELVLGHYLKGIAENGHLFDTGTHDKFRPLGSRAGPRARKLWEVRIVRGSAKGHGQLRFIGGFLGKTFVLCLGLRKKTNRLDPNGIERAAKIFSEHECLVGGKP